MSESTHRLIDGLAEDLAPVRPVPRLRSAFALILAVWAALLGVVLLGSGGSLPSAGSLAGDRVYLASFVGLLIAAVAGVVSALAAGVPGRERLEQAALWTTSVGLLAAAAACVSGMGVVGAELTALPDEADGMCFRHGVFFSLLPAGVILGFLVRGWALHPLRAVAVALLGSGAIGAVVVHLACGAIGPRHLLISHLSVPIVLAILGLYPLGILLRRLRG